MGEDRIYVPGQFTCPKCDFALTQSVLSASTGTVHVDDRPGEKCPNCNVPLWRVSWKDEAHSLGRAFEDKFDECERLKKALMEISDPSQLTTHGDPTVLRDRAREALNI